MKNSTLLFVLLFAFNLIMINQSNLVAQQNSPFNIPATVQVPEWVIQTDWNNPNIYKIDSLIKLYKNVEKSNNNVDYQKKDMLESDEEPYMIAYIRWRNQMTPFIKPNGFIKYDSNFYINHLENAISIQDSKKNQLENLQNNNSNWKPLGPVETFHHSNKGAACSQVNIYQIAISESNPNVLYSASETGIIFKSLDKGLNWTSVSDQLPAIGCNSLIVDPKNENIVYCNASGYALLKTINGGSTWSMLKSYTGKGGERIVINPKNGRILIIGETSIYYSDNEGTDWIQSKGSTIVGYYYDMILNPKSADTVYAVGSSNNKEILMYRSTDGGTNFTKITNGLAGIENAGARFGVSIANSSIVYCIALGNTTGPKLLKSTDRGNSWKIAVSSSNTSLTGGGNKTGLDMSNGQGFFDLDIVIDSKNANNVIVGTTTAYKSIDGGLNFAPLGGYGGPFGIHPDIQCTRTLGDDTYIATDGGVNYSSDFFSELSNWSVRNNGLTGSDFWGFGQGWEEDIVVGGRYHNGNTAIFENYNDGNALALGGGEDATGHVFHGRERTVGFRDIGTYSIPSDLNGKVLKAEFSNSLWPQDDYYGLFSSKLVIDPRYSNVFYVGKDSILWKSSNSGASYISLNNFGNGNRVWRFEIARSNYNVIYLCATYGVYKTTDAGNSWTKLTLPVTYNSYNSDIAVNPLNENEVYVCMAHNAAKDKVLMSKDGGSTWINITGKSLENTTVAYLQYHGGTDGGVYAITSSNYTATKVFYRDNSMNEWLDYSNGIPQNYYARNGGLIFYRDNKMRLAGSRGVWETLLYTNASPVAQPMSDKKYIACSKDTVRFSDYSMLNYANAKWQWSFPGASWVSDSTVRNPKVLYSKLGNYSVTLTVTDSTGKSNTKTVKDMVSLIADNCMPDTLVGNCLKMNGTSQTVNLGKVNINSNTFSISCWVKPSGNQNSFAQLISHYGCPGSPNYGLGVGFTFSGYTPNLQLCYTDETVNYSNYSGLFCDSTQWNFVVLTYSPTGVKIYLNGNYSPVNTKNMPVLDLSQTPFYVNADIHNQGGRYKGQIEEIKFYDYTLNQDEVREKMHLIQNEPQLEKGLVKYFQFNKYDPISETVYDALSGDKSDIPTANIVASTAPIGTGTFSRKTNVNSAGIHSFEDADIDLYLPVDGIYPDGEVVAFHLQNNPDQSPDNKLILPGYFIVNNYGKNLLFTQPDSVKFRNLNVNVPYYNAGNFKLYNRRSGDFAKTWSNELDSANTFLYEINNSSLTWTNCTNFKRFGQFVIVNQNEIPTSVNQDYNLNSNDFEVSEMFPNPTKEFCTFSIKSTKNQHLGISISDISGNTVYKVTEEINIGKNTILLNLPKLSTGMYFVNIKLVNEVSIIRKLIVE